MFGIRNNTSQTNTCSYLSSRDCSHSFNYLNPVQKKETKILSLPPGVLILYTPTARNRKRARETNSSVARANKKQKQAINPVLLRMKQMVEIFVYSKEANGCHI